MNDDTIIYRDVLLDMKMYNIVHSSSSPESKLYFLKKVA